MRLENRILFKWLKEKDWQTVLSTHSIDVLYELLEVNPKNTTLIQLKKTADDILHHSPLTLNELEDLIDSNSASRLLVDSLAL